MSLSKAGRGVNSASLRLYNERALLLALRRAGEASKADPARMAELTNTAVGSIVQTLTEEGLVCEAGRRQDGQRGQPASLIRLQPRGAFGLGVAGPSQHRVRAGRLQRPHPGQPCAPAGPAPSAAGPGHGARRPDALCEALAPAERKRLLGIGLAQPYNLGARLRELDLQDAALRDSFHAWDDTDFGAALAAATGLPVFSENDGTAAAIAELFYGRHHAQDFLYVFLGPAIGGGVVLDGDCVRGVSGNAGDIGMMPVAPSTLDSAPRTGRACDILLARACSTRWRATCATTARRWTATPTRRTSRRAMRPWRSGSTTASTRWRRPCRRRWRCSTCPCWSSMPTSMPALSAR